MSIVELIDFFRNIKGVPIVGLSNLVTFPKYCSPLYLYPRHIKEGLDKFYNYLKDYKKVSDKTYKCDDLAIFGINNMKSVKYTEDFLGNDVIQKRMIEWIDFCLIARQNNEDIYELASYLKEYK